MIESSRRAVFVRWSKRRRSTVGVEGLVGRTGGRGPRADARGSGQARRRVWEARAPSTTSCQVEEVIVNDVDGLVLEVRVPRVILRLTLEYDGTGFRAGRASRASGRSKGSCATRSTRCCRAGSGWRWRGARTPASMRRAGRELEARGWPTDRASAEALNTALPDDVAVVAAEARRDGFHARFSATGRSYRYVVLAAAPASALEARRALWWPRPSTSTRSTSRAALLVGEHDFRPSRPPRPSTRCSARTSAPRRGSGTATGSSSRSPPTRSCATWCARWWGRCSSRAGSDRSDCSQGGRGRRPGMTAPPWGLYLEHVDYDARRRD